MAILLVWPWINSMPIFIWICFFFYYGQAPPVESRTWWLVPNLWDISLLWPPFGRAYPEVGVVLDTFHLHPVLASRCWFGASAPSHSLSYDLIWLMHATHVIYCTPLENFSPLSLKTTSNSLVETVSLIVDLGFPSCLFFVVYSTMCLLFLSHHLLYCVLIFLL